MLLREFRPRSRLETKTTIVDVPRFPVIDAHNHLGETFGGGWINRPVADMHAAMDEAGVTHLVDLDGGWGEDILQRHLDRLAASKRFRVFGGVDWARWPELGDAFPEYAARRLEAQAAWGATGLKIWKPFGLHIVDHHGELVRVEDPRLAPVWETAGRLKLPVMIHVGDPVAFFDPVDATNERWEELQRHPECCFHGARFPQFCTIVDGLRELVRSHPATTFIGAHVGGYAENLAWIGEMLDECPNFFVDISGRIGELGRQPYSARRFFLRYPDRILFGLDVGIEVAWYRLHYRFLETDDEYFNYNVSDQPLQGRWMVSGLYLPDDVLEKVYRLNAARLFNLTL